MYLRLSFLSGRPYEMAVSTELAKLYWHCFWGTCLYEECPIDDVLILALTKVVICPHEENNWHMLVCVSCYQQVRQSSKQGLQTKRGQMA